MAERLLIPKLLICLRLTAQCHYYEGALPQQLFHGSKDFAISGDGPSSFFPNV